jgi:hypothetical protein
MKHFELVENHSDETYLAVLFLATQIVDIRRKLRSSEAVWGEGCESRRGPRQDTEDLHLHYLLQPKFCLEVLQAWPRLEDLVEWMILLSRQGREHRLHRPSAPARGAKPRIVYISQSVSLRLCRNGRGLGTYLFHDSLTASLAFW